MSNVKMASAMLLVMAALASGPAFAGAPQSPCTNLPRFGWVSSEEVEARLRQSGFQLLRLRITNEACYTALVTDAAGQKMELRIHPGTSEVLAPDDNSTGAVRR